MSAGYAIERGLSALSADDWAWTGVRATSSARKEMAKLVGLARFADPARMSAKAAGVRDIRACMLASVVTRAAVAVATELLGDAFDQPSVDDLRRIWPAWVERCGEALVRLSLLTLIDSDHRAEQSASQFLQELGDGHDTPAGRAHAPAPATHHTEPVSEAEQSQAQAPEASPASCGLQDLAPLGAIASAGRTAGSAPLVLAAASEAPPALVAASDELLAAALDTLTEAGRGMRQGQDSLLAAADALKCSAVASALPDQAAVAAASAAAADVRAALQSAAAALAEVGVPVALEPPLGDALDAAHAAVLSLVASRRREAEQRSHAALRDQAAESASALAPLAMVQGPTEYEEDLGALRSLAAAPDDEKSLVAWFEAVPVLQALLRQLTGQSLLDREQSQQLARLTSPALVGLLAMGELQLPRPAVQEPLDAEDSPGNTESAGAERATAEPLPREQPAEPLVPFEPAAPKAPPNRAVVDPAAPATPAAALRELPQSEDDDPVAPDDARDAAPAAPAESPAAGLPTKIQQAAGVDARPPADEVWVGMCRLVDDGHIGAAAWAAQAFAPAWGSALQALTVAVALRSDVGPLSDVLWRQLQGVDSVEGGSAEVLAAALCLATPIAPYTGAAELLDDMIPRLSDGPVQTLARAVVAAVRHGLVLGASAGVPPGQEAHNQIAEVAAAAAAQLEAGAARTLKYQRATRVYQRWIAEDGPLGVLLRAVRADDRTKADEVRRSLLALADEREIDRLIEATDARLRGPNTTARIVAHSRHRLLELARESLEIVEAWLQAVAAVQRVTHDDRIGLHAEELHAAALAARDTAQHPVESDAFERGLATRSVHVATDLLVRRLEDGVPEEAEPVAADVLDAWLPFVGEATLTRQDWEHVPAELLAPLLQAPYRPADEVYDALRLRLDHIGTARLVDALERADAEAARSLAQRREADLREAHAARLRRLDRLRSEFDELESYPGAITTESAVVVRGLLLDAQAEADLAKAMTLLDEAEALLRLSRDEQVARLRSDVDAAADLSGDDAAAVHRLLDDGALSAAHERLDAARGGEEPVTASDRHQHVELQRRFWGECVDAAVGQQVFARATAALRAGTGLEPFGPGPADETTRELRADALEAWQELFEHKRGQGFEGRLRRVLAALALQGPTPKRDSDPRMRGSDLAVDVADARPVQPVITHELGSTAQGRYRVVVVWEQMTPDRLISLAVSDTKHGPHLILFRGVLNRAQRMALAAAARAEGASGRTAVVVDDAVALTMACQALPTFASLEHLVLPFAQVAAFAPDVAGNVPPELFRGRRRELEEVVNPNGSSFVYGGRQVGKSALLRAAAREVERAKDPDRRAVYLDVKGLGLGVWRDVEELWLELLDELRRKNVITDRTSRTARGDAATSHIRNWLDETPSRRLLVLLDECDDLLDADARHDFPIIQRLRQLMSVSDRRFKVVLAGLHQVQRFERQRNVPLAHLAQQPINVGPLQPADAVDLLQTPLLALGYTLDDAATWRVLSHTNYQAGLIQVYGQALVRALHAGPRLGTLPAVVDLAFVDGVYAQGDLGEQMRRRFMLTINLDPRYRCIAYVLALRNLVDGMEADYADQELQEACAYWWPDGFDGMRLALFRGLVDEMVGLGVLVRINERMRIRNPNVVRMLGRRPYVEAELLDFEGQRPTSGFDASLYRRALPDGGRSPLTEQELAALVEPDQPGLALVGGSAALGADRVVDTLNAKLGDRQEIEYRPEVPPQDVARQLRAATGRTVLVCDARALRAPEARQLALDVQAVLDGMARGTSMRRVVLILGAAALELWAEQVAPPHSLEGCVRLSLRRYTVDELEAWSGEEALDLDAATARALFESTGGWPLLVDVVMRSRKHGWAAAMNEARGHLRSGDLASRAVDGDDDAANALRLLGEIGEPVTWSLLEDLAEGIVTARTRDALSALQLTVAVSDGRFAIEPRLAEAVRAGSTS